MGGKTQIEKKVRLIKSAQGLHHLRVLLHPQDTTLSKVKTMHRLWDNYTLNVSITGSGPQSGSNQQSWGSGADRRQEGSGSASRQGDRWAGGGSMVQPDARPIAYQAMGAPPIVANVPTGMFVATTSMAPGTIMMAPTNLQGQNRQQDQRFDAYKSLGNIRRYWF